MIITRFCLKNWKNFREVDVALGKRMFLVGANASGKSNFLDAFRFLREVAENGLSKAVDARGGISSLRCLAARKTPDIALELAIDDIWEYRLEFGGKKGEAAELRQETARSRAGTDAEWKTVLDRPDKNDKKDPLRLTQTALEQISVNVDFRPVADFLKTISYQHILPQVVRDPQGFSPNPVQNDPYGRDFVFRVLNTPKKTREARLSRINKALQVAVPQFEGLDVTLDKKTGVPHLIVKYRHWRPEGAKQDESSFSDGTLRLLALMWSMFEAKGPLLLEEPELSLHTSVVQCLPSMFAKLDRARKKESRQVLISTHSEALLSDPGVGPGEILTLVLEENGTTVSTPEEADKESMRAGLTAADVFIPKTAPREAHQLSLFDIS